jgi:iron complex outermembrane receptor protein
VLFRSGQDLNDPKNSIEDEQSFISASFDDAIAPDWRLSWRLGYHRYRYQGYFSFLNTFQNINDDSAEGEWWNGELRLQTTALENHRLQWGAEWQDNLRQLQQNRDIPGKFNLNKDYRSTRWGIFLQDEIRLFDSLSLTAGARYDYNPLGGGSLNPRISLAWRPLRSTALKLVYGSAFRAPTVFERYYDTGSEGFDLNPHLGPERVESLELGIEHYPTSSSRLAASLYHNWTSNLINLVSLPPKNNVTYLNSGRLTSQGMELSAEQRFNNGMRLNFSYSLQQTETAAGQSLTNSPAHMLKLHFAAPDRKSVV